MMRKEPMLPQRIQSGREQRAYQKEKKQKDCSSKFPLDDQICMLAQTCTLHVEHSMHKAEPPVITARCSLQVWNYYNCQLIPFKRKNDKSIVITNRIPEPINTKMWTEYFIVVIHKGTLLFRKVKEGICWYRTLYYGSLAIYFRIPHYFFFSFFTLKILPMQNNCVMLRGQCKHLNRQAWCEITENVLLPKIIL